MEMQVEYLWRWEIALPCRIQECDALGAAAKIILTTAGRDDMREREREMKYTFEFFEPATYVLECTSPADVIHDESSDRASVIRGSHSTEPLLTCRIPDLRLDFLSFNLHALRLKLHADGSLGVVVELVARVSREQIWFPHRRVTDEYDLEEVIFALIIVVRHFFPSSLQRTYKKGKLLATKNVGSTDNRPTKTTAKHLQKRQNAHSKIHCQKDLLKQLLIKYTSETKVQSTQTHKSLQKNKLLQEKPQNAQNKAHDAMKRASARRHRPVCLPLCSASL